MLQVSTFNRDLSGYKIELEFGTLRLHVIV